LDVPGASRTLLEAVVPYSAPAMAALLGGPPEEFCSDATARSMAMAAFHRARRYEGPEATPAGVACTASLASDRPKRGPHRVHLALQTAAATAAWHLQLQKDRRTRSEEERLVGRLLLNIIAAACDLPDRLHLDLVEGERVEESRTEAPPAWQDLLLGKVESVCVSPLALGEGRHDVGQVANLPPQATGQVANLPHNLILPGAFNPLHTGHRRMVEVAQSLFGRPAAMELSILNVDKPPLDYIEIKRRLGQFSVEQTVYLTRAATFEEKSRLFAGATFLVGADTLPRVAAPRYYGDNLSARDCAIRRIAGRGCRFLVFGRLLDGSFVRLGDLELPDSLRSLCREVPPETFREDVSSTALRKSGL
jgi:hypothetical protein